MTNDSLFEMPGNIHTRWASPENWDGAKGAAGQVNNGRKGSPCFSLKAGEHKVLAHAENTSGTVRRIWITINDRSPQMLRGLRLDMYWDDAEHPAVSAPLGYFERRDDWSSCAWFYLDRPTNDLPPLATVAERTVGLLCLEDTARRADA